MTRPVLELAGVGNFRDIGGCAAADGRWVRTGQVFRSGRLSRRTDSDLDRIARLGIRVVYDLRTDEELAGAPSQLPATLPCERFPISGTAAKSAELTELVTTGRLLDAPPDFLFRIYDGIAEAAAGTLGALLTRLSEPGASPALIHCTAGKDRTGVAVAMLLAALGVGDEDILADYTRSAADYTEREVERLRPRLEQINITADHYRAVFGAPRTALSSLLDVLRERFGTVEDYLHTAAGLTPQALTALRERLLVADPQA